MARKVTIALIGAGMFGGDIHARAYADLQRNGISGLMGRVGLDAWARDLADVEFELVAVGTRSEVSAQHTRANFEQWTGHAPKPYWGETPWEDVLRDFPDLDVMAVATPDNLHTPVVLAALHNNTHVITEKPMCLSIREADEMVELADEKGLVCAVDMHKRYDPITCVFSTILPIALASHSTGWRCWKNPSKSPRARLSGPKTAIPFRMWGRIGSICFTITIGASPCRSQRWGKKSGWWAMG